MRVLAIHMTLPIIRRLFVTLTGTMKRANALGQNTLFKYSFQEGKIRVDRNHFRPYVPQKSATVYTFKFPIQFFYLVLTLCSTFHSFPIVCKNFAEIGTKCYAKEGFTSNISSLLSMLAVLNCLLAAAYLFLRTFRHTGKVLERRGNKY